MALTWPQLINNGVQGSNHVAANALIGGCLRASSMRHRFYVIAVLPSNAELSYIGYLSQLLCSRWELKPYFLSLFSSYLFAET